MFQLVPQPTLFPAVELLGLLSPKGFVDTGVDMPIGGRVYLSEIAAGECARLYGWESPEETLRLKRLLGDAHDLITAMQAELEGLQTVKAVLERARTEEVAS